MRRLDPRTKEIICWVRSSTVQAREKLEFFYEDKIDEAGGEVAEFEADMTEVLVESHRESLGKAILIEILGVVNSFDLHEKYITRKGSAFPHLQDLKGVAFNESVLEYMTDLIQHTLNLPHIPAMTIIDELEEWLNNLYNYHLENSKGIE